jgi:prolyl-tRNA synthetase
VHGDNKGLRLPPRVAPIQCIVVPIYYKDKDPLRDKCNELVAVMKRAGVRAESDCSENYNPGWKFNKWEMKGVPLRMELGPRDLEAETVVLVRRDTGEKQTVKWSLLSATIPPLLQHIQDTMLAQARKTLHERMTRANDWPSFSAALAAGNIALVPFCATTECEEAIKKKTGEEAEAAELKQQEEREKAAAAAGSSSSSSSSSSSDGSSDAAAPPDEGGEMLTGSAKSLCIPFEQDVLPAGTKCVHCGQPAVCKTLFGRSY